MAKVTPGRYAFLALRDAAQRHMRWSLKYSVPAGLLALGTLAIGGPVALGFAPLVAIFGVATALTVQEAAQDCRDGFTRTALNFPIKKVATRLLRREAAFLAEQTDADVPPVFITSNPYVPASYSRDHHIFFMSRDFLRNHSRPQILAVMAHELGHAHEPVKADWRELGVGLLRVARFARALGLGVMPALALVLPLTPVLAATAAYALAPYALNVALQTTRRHMEYRADHFAAAACGTPVPLLQYFAKCERMNKPAAPSNSSGGALAAFGRLAARIPRNPGEAFFWLSYHGGPFCREHPTLRQRRLKLIRQPRNRAQIAALKEACTSVRRPAAITPS